MAGSNNNDFAVLHISQDEVSRTHVLSYLEHRGVTVIRGDDPEKIAAEVADSSFNSLVLLVSYELALEYPLRAILKKHTSQKRCRIIALGKKSFKGESRPSYDCYIREPIQSRQVYQAIKGIAQNREIKTLRGIFTKQHDRQQIPRRGQLEQIAYSSLFTSYWKVAFNGVIALKSGNILRRVDFLNGFPVAARSNLNEEHLLSYLLRNEMIPDSVYRELVPEVVSSDWNPMSLLVESELVSRTLLEEAQSSLVKEISISCLDWKDAEYRFSARIEPAPNRNTVEINPFEIYLEWLEQAQNTDLLNLRAARIADMGLASTELIDDHSHLLGNLLERMPDGLSSFNGKTQFSELIENRTEQDLRALLVMLVEMGVLTPVSIAKKKKTKRKVFSSMAGGGKQLARIRKIVERDVSRIGKTNDAYQILGLSERATTADVIARFHRFSRFYQPQSFERIGDLKLQSSARELLASFRNAATEILGSPPPELPARPGEQAAPDSTDPSTEEQVLAGIIFEDGKSYLKLEAYDEAFVYFKRAISLAPSLPEYRAYLGWSVYKQDNNDPVQVAEARQILLSVLKQDSQNEKALYYLGRLYEDSGRPDRAIECWEKAARNHTGSVEIGRAIKRLQNE